MHISLGSVAYPIDWDNLGIKEIALDVALKFNIGELDIIQTREDVKYTPRTKEAILEKIKLVQQEFIDRWNSQDFELEDIKKYQKLINNKYYRLVFENIEFNLNWLLEDCSTLKYYIYKSLKNYTSYIPSDYF